MNRRGALLGCANWDAGKCIGCMIKVDNDGTIYQVIDSKKSGKDCNPDDCKYFEELVVPVIS